MSVWSDLVNAAQRLFGAEPAPESRALEAFACGPEPGDVGFTAAVIGLAAKMARADGDATDAEMAAAASVFRPPTGEEAAFRRAFGLMKQTVAGHESYARQIGRKYKDRPCLLEDVMDGLFHIAAADGKATGAELDYLASVARHLGLDDRAFARIRATHLGPDENDPYAVLGLAPGASLEEARAAWRKLVADSHPDQMTARGAPPEFVRYAAEKTAALNAAFARIRADHSDLVPAG